MRRSTACELYYEERGAGTPHPRHPRRRQLGGLLGGRRRDARRARARDHLRPPRQQPKRATRPVRDDERPGARGRRARAAARARRRAGGPDRPELRRHGRARPRAAAPGRRSSGIALLEAGPMGLSAEYDAWFTSLRDRCERRRDASTQSARPSCARCSARGTSCRDVWRDVFTGNGPALLAELRGERVDGQRPARRAAASRHSS